MECQMNHDVRGQTNWNPGSAIRGGRPFAIQKKLKELGLVRVSDDEITVIGGGWRQSELLGMHSSPVSVSSGGEETLKIFPPLQTTWNVRVVKRRYFLSFASVSGFSLNALSVPAASALSFKAAVGSSLEQTVAPLRPRIGAM